MPLLPSADGQSLWFTMSTGRTSHQIGNALTRELSMTWLWFGVGTKILPVGGFAAFPRAASVTDKSTEEACIVQVLGTGLLGSGHCVETMGWVLHASGRKPNALISAVPSAAPQSSPGRPPLGHGMASAGF